MVRALIWNENIHERSNDLVRRVYPSGVHECIAAALRTQSIEVRTATLEQVQHGLTYEALEWAEVLFWWGHVAHHAVDDAIVDRVQARVLEGLGLVALHSAHYSKILRRLLGTTCSLTWREAAERERVWVVTPGHPIALGLDRCFVIEQSETYGEPFAVPTPDETVFLSWYPGGEVFRSGCTWRRGNGRIFYFSPGHETFPIYHQREVQVVLGNAARWAAQTSRVADACPNVPALEPPHR